MNSKMTSKNDDDKIISVWVNPLQFLEIDEPWASLSKKSVTAKNILNYLCAPGIKSDVKSVIERYKQISTEEQRLLAPPVEPKLLEKLVWPLRYAKADYAIGNYIGTISLCGVTAEMLAILLFEISDIRHNNKPVTKSRQKQMFGREFEKLGQERRVEVLCAYEVIDDSHTRAFDTIREIRRRYLHFWSETNLDVSKDAVKAFESAVSLVVQVIGQDVKDGKLYLNPTLLQYLQRH